MDVILQDLLQHRTRQRPLLTHVKLQSTVIQFNFEFQLLFVFFSPTIKDCRMIKVSTILRKDKISDLSHTRPHEIMKTQIFYISEIGKLAVKYRGIDKKLTFC